MRSWRPFAAAADTWPVPRSEPNGATGRWCATPTAVRWNWTRRELEDGSDPGVRGVHGQLDLLAVAVEGGGEVAQEARVTEERLTEGDRGERDPGSPFPSLVVPGYTQGNLSQPNFDRDQADTRCLHDRRL